MPVSAKKGDESELVSSAPDYISDSTNDEEQGSPRDIKARYEPLLPGNTTVKGQQPQLYSTSIQNNEGMNPDTPRLLSVGKGCLTRCVCCAKNASTPGQTILAGSHLLTLSLLILLMIMMLIIAGSLPDASSQITGFMPDVMEMKRVTCSAVQLLKESGFTNVTTCNQ